MTEKKCKVCLDAGKSREMYSSHWVKDQRGNVVCPTLLSQKCQRCSKPGHTVKFCTFTEKKAPESAKQNICENKTKNLKQIVEDFPALNPNRNITYRAHQKHYAKEAEEEAELNPNRNITYRAHQKHYAKEAEEEDAELEKAKFSYMDALIQANEMKKLQDITNELRAAKAEREADEARGIVERPVLIKDITLRGSVNPNHYFIEEGEVYDPFFGSEKKREISKHNRACFLGENGLGWMDVIDSEDEEEEEEEFEEEEEEEFEEDYDW